MGRTRLVTAISILTLSTLLAAPGPAAAADNASAPAVGHVFVINLENKGYTTTWGPESPAPYLSQALRVQGAFLSEYYGIGHPSLPNYVAQISGQGPSAATQADCITYSDFVATGVGDLGQVLGDGCVYPASVMTLADQFTAAGLSWKTYQEDIGNSATESRTCRHPEIGQRDPTVVARPGDEYTTRHNPFMYFHSVIDSPSCAKRVVGLDALARDLRKRKRTPNYSLIGPNLCNSGHDATCANGGSGGLAAADAWLQEWVPKILRSPAFRRDGVLVITFDEAENDTRACCGSPPPPNVAQAGGTGPGGGRVGALVLSPFVRAGSTSAVPYNHYSLLCTIENLFGLGHLGYAAQPGLACFGTDVFPASGTQPSS